jgi:hypothetical protein
MEMNYSRVLKRAWHIVWDYRVLWVFGIIFALVTFSWGTWALLDRGDDWERDGIVITTLDGETFWDALQTRYDRQLIYHGEGLLVCHAGDLPLDSDRRVLFLFQGRS